MSFPCGKHHRRRRDCYRATEQPLSHLTVTAPLAQGSRKRRSLPIGANGVHTVGRGLAPAASSPSPLGEGPAEWRGMRGSRSSERRLYSTERDCTDGCLRILPLIRRVPRQLPPRGKPKSDTNFCIHTKKRLLNPAVEQPLSCFCLLDIALIDFRNHAGDLADHVMDHQCVFVG